ncbi:MAG: VOC family protein [Saprospiraceae bacterium]|nr:VOC family protein [Saprospiraceae bacterium]
MNNLINWVEIPVRDMTRAVKFYEGILDCRLNVQDFGELKMAWFPMEQGAPGASGSLVQNDAYNPSYSGSVIYLSVEDINRTLTLIEQQGPKIINPKRSIGQFGHVAHFEDTEGNRVALHANQ